MFNSARLTLTAWYLGIIMLICMMFSLVIYLGIDNELRRYERFERRRIQREQELFFPPNFPRRVPTFDPTMIVETRHRLLFILALVNLGIVGFTGAASYFLAGRTLKPIKTMVDEQHRFITDASHELRTPLTALRSEIEVSLRDKNLSLTDAKALLKSNLEEVVNLQALSDHLMRLAQYQTKNGGLTFEQVSLAEIIDRSIKKISPIAGPRHITIVNDNHDYQIWGDRQSLTELFVILLDNAVKYSPAHTTIQLTSKKIDHTIDVAVKDQGEGISGEDSAFIFDRFFRADKSRSKEKSPGYGLGLSIGQKIAHLHNGEIYVTSSLGKGSTFTVSLPIF